VYVEGVMVQPGRVLVAVLLFHQVLESVFTTTDRDGDSDLSGRTVFYGFLEFLINS
jgi:hypothetical protein